VIAAHPRADYKKYPDVFGKRSIIHSQTIHLVKDCRFVIGHASTSLNMAVLYNKPILQVSQNEYSEGYKLFIKAWAKALNLKTINLSLSFPQNLNDYLKYDHMSYIRHVEYFIKHPSSPERLIWEIVAEHVSNNL